MPRARLREATDSAGFPRSWHSAGVRPPLFPRRRWIEPPRESRLSLGRLPQEIEMRHVSKGNVSQSSIIGTSPSIQSRDARDTVRIYRVQFEWNQAKNRSNWLKHGISFEIAALVFEDPRCVVSIDRVHESGLQRWSALGSVGGGTGIPYSAGCASLWGG